MYETIRIVKKLKPKYVIWENVKNLLSKKHRHNFDNYLDKMKELGYENYYQVLNAKDYGIPQNRERVFTISILGGGEFKFPEKQELKLRLKDMLEEQVDEKYYLSDKQMERMNTTQFNQGKLEKRVQDEVAETLLARDYKDPKCVRIGGLYDTETTKHQAGSIWEASGLAPTIETMQGGNRQPMIKIKNNTRQGYLEAYEGDGVYTNTSTKRGTVTPQAIHTITSLQDCGVVVTEPPKSRKDTKTMEKYCEYCGNKLERKRFNGVLEDFTVFKNRKYCNRECMKRAYLKIGENKQTYSNAHATARKINELILHKECCETCGSTNNLDIHHIDGNWQNNNLDNLMCLCRSCHAKYEFNKNKIGDDEPMDDRLRIRKLTPKECWRL